MRRQTVSATLVVFLAIAAPRPSLAQGRAGDVAAAQALFDDARTLMKAGKFAEACPKLEESERLDAGPGTEFNLADCYEHAGRTASAWAEFATVADSLRALGQHDCEKFARDRATALQPKLTKLAVNVAPAARVPGLEVKRDGEVLREVQWGSGVPVDPGKHTIAATAPGTKPWQQTVNVSGEGKVVSVDVPTLGPAQAAPAPTPATPSTTPTPASTSTPAADTSTPAPASEPSRPLGGQKIAAILAAGLGVVGLGVGGYFGSQAISKHNQYAPLCPNNVCVNQTGVQLHDDAASDATISTVTMAVGAVALAGGVLLWLTAPSGSSAPKMGLHVVPSVGNRSGGLWLQGAW